MKISVIIPTYNEESTICDTLQDLCSHHQPDEIIVVDGGSTDKTVSLASKWANVISSAKGRARQMNEGTRIATGDVFLFLHADTRLPKNGLEQIKEVVSQGASAGRFRMKFDNRQWLLRFYETYTRFHFFSYGDQGFFVTRKLFEKLYGFSETVSFEDIDFYQRLRWLTSPVIIQDPVVTSARRFTQNGCVRQKLINIFLVALCYSGFNILGLKGKLYPEIR
ncbi:MAG: TIGR04283 family arsenosugar biosynthesis glycosyltransferase [Candidatus Omnitrophica bacterium]|nr:TIGR04283 family arsenosugar biosynthesis glycosyltransferase [Candidatus Omnitrophota bacterium]